MKNKYFKGFLKNMFQLKFIEIMKKILTKVEIIFKNNSKESILEFIKYYSSKDVYELIGNLYFDDIVIMFCFLYSSDTKDQYLQFLNSINPYCCSTSSISLNHSKPNENNADENCVNENGDDEKRDKYLHIQSIKCYFPLEWNSILKNIKSYYPFKKDDNAPSITMSIDDKETIDWLFNTCDHSTFSNIIVNYLRLKSIDLIEYTIEKYNLNGKEKPLLYSIPFYNAIIDFNVNEISKLFTLKSMISLSNSFIEKSNEEEDDVFSDNNDNVSETFKYLVNSNFKNFTTTALKEILNLLFIEVDKDFHNILNDITHGIQISIENLEERFLPILFSTMYHSIFEFNLLTLYKLDISNSPRDQNCIYDLIDSILEYYKKSTYIPSTTSSSNSSGCSSNSSVYGELDEEEDQFFNFKISIVEIFDDKTSSDESLYKLLERSLNINRIDLFFNQLIKFKLKIKGGNIKFSDKVFITTLKVLDENSFKSFFNHDYCSNQFYSFYFTNKDKINLYDNSEIVKQLISLKSDDKLSPKNNNKNIQN
ncbi:hypothetical protein ACTFIZ_005028 [Dictyostelium cf. discoideum]